MKQQFSEYLTSIGINGLFRERIEDICALFDDLWKVEVFDIFVADYVDSEGRRNYADLFLFTPEAIVAYSGDVVHRFRPCRPPT